MKKVIVSLLAVGGVIALRRANADTAERERAEQEPPASMDHGEAVAV